MDFTTIQSSDYLEPDSRTAINGNFANSVYRDGWVAATDTWTYQTSTTFTVNGDVTSKLGVGMKVKLVNSTLKYFYITSVVYAPFSTTVTVNGGSDYTLANAAITGTYYSCVDTPVGFPNFFTWTPGHTGFSVNPVVNFSKFSIKGGSLHLIYHVSSAGTSNATTFTITGLPVPVASWNISSEYFGFIAMDNGSLQSNARMDSAGTSTVLTVYPLISGGSWVASGVKYVQGFQIWYPI